MFRSNDHWKIFRTLPGKQLFLKLQPTKIALCGGCFLTYIPKIFFFFLLSIIEGMPSCPGLANLHRYSLSHKNLLSFQNYPSLEFFILHRQQPMNCLSVFDHFAGIWSHQLKKSLMENFIFCAYIKVDIISVAPIMITMVVTR